MAMPGITVRFKSDTLSKLRALASIETIRRDRRVPPSRLIRRAVEDFLARQSETEQEA
jgi:predicted transcriptional regulator